MSVGILHLLNFEQMTLFSEQQFYQLSFRVNYSWVFKKPLEGKIAVDFQS